eukprot:TRINITY_DN54391_c0_g1_i1.p1 TRINITY_DN54391_c0_g1~~TRINITY_DN54391_c0_g1_i1.p1  ORF type:complete len:312 (-),score=58.87 TRINITY_DN54391_c0_g1_i1:34-969(-)
MLRLQRAVESLGRTSAAFAYGSAVFAQAGHKGKMVDMLLVVEDAEDWHRTNLQRFREHYSGLRWLGPKACARVQHLGAGVYYNAMVTLPCGLYCKYGVITREDLLGDLGHWSHLYVAGRMHKPLAVLQEDEQVSAAIAANRLSALRCALLMLPQTFTLRQLLEQIAGLSYRGDCRNMLAEHPRKVQNIVEGQFDELRAIYEPLLPQLGVAPASGSEPSATAECAGRLEWAEQSSPQARRHMFEELPSALQVAARKGAGSTAESPHDAAVLDKAARSIVFRASCAQTVKGAFTAGVVRSTRYAAEKFAKRWS